VDPLVLAVSYIELRSLVASAVDEDGVRAEEPSAAADLGNSPLSITETPQLIAGVGCR